MFNPYCQKPSCTGNPNGTSVIHFIRFIGSLGCHSEEVVVETFRFPSPSFNLTMMSVHLCLCIRVYVYVYMYVYICMCMYMCIVCTCICNCKCVCMNVCMYARMAVWFYGMYQKKYFLNKHRQGGPVWSSGTSRSSQAGGPGFNSQCRPSQTGGQLLQDPAVRGHKLGRCPKKPHNMHSQFPNVSSPTCSKLHVSGFSTSTPYLRPRLASFVQEVLFCHPEKKSHNITTSPRTFIVLYLTCRELSNVSRLICHIV